VTTDFAPQEPSDAVVGEGEYAAMADSERDQLQAEVDASEHDVEVRYERWQEFMVTVADAARRADAMIRLENALALSSASY
jgi:hypothetical protein